MALAYLYYRALGNAQLAAIGLLSFAAVAQLAPAFFGGLFWRRATARGAMGGMLVGIAVWGYTLFLPSFLDGTPPAPHCATRSVRHRGAAAAGAVRRRHAAASARRALALSLNIVTYIVLSLVRPPSSIERLQADMFGRALAPMRRTSAAGAPR